MDRVTRSILARRAQALRREMTEAEKRLWYRFLREYPIPFVNQKVIGNYIVDFYCKKVRLSIELDGSQHYEERGLAYDAVRTTFLETLEIYELRFPNDIVFENFDGVCQVIHDTVQSRRHDIIETPLSLLKNKR